MDNRIGSLALGLLLLVSVDSAAPEVRCDFFQTPGGFLRAKGGASGNLRCGLWPSLEAAKQECWTNRECDGISWGRWGKGSGGCLKKNRAGGFKRSRNFTGYHKTTMGCCSGDHFEPGQCKPRQEKLVSLGQTATQSSTAYGGDAGRAVDGNMNTNFGGRSCTHTKSTKNPWWQVDLGKPYEITRIVITNRGDCCWGRLSGFEVSVGNKQPYTLNPTCVKNGRQGRGQAKEWSCPLTGRYVTVSLRSGYLTLCEVQVFAAVTDFGPQILPPVVPVPHPGSGGSPSPTGVPVSYPGSGGSSKPTVIPAPYPGSGGSSKPTVIPAPYPGSGGSPSPTGVPVSYPGSGGSSKPTVIPAPYPGSGGSSKPTVIPAPYPGSGGSSKPTVIPAPYPGSGGSSKPTVIPAPYPGSGGSSKPTVIPAPYPGSGGSSKPTAIPAPYPGSGGSSKPTAIPAPYPGSGGSPTPTEIPVPYPGSGGSPTPTEIPVPYPGSGGSPSPTGVPVSYPGSGGSPTPTEIPVPYPGSGGSPTPTEIPVPYPGSGGSPTPTEIPVPYPGSGGSPTPTEIPVPYPGSGGSPTPTEIPVPYPGSGGSPTPTEVPVPYPGSGGSPTPTEIPVPHPGSGGGSGQGQSGGAGESPFPGSPSGPGYTPGGPYGNGTTIEPVPIPHPQPVTPSAPVYPSPEIPSVPVASPTPVSTPIPVPSPKPVPTPIPVPSPKPVPTPIPWPSPKPVPTPIPGPIPAPAGVGGIREDIVSFGKNVRQSSTQFNGVAERANDGNRNSVYGMNSCSHTSFMKNPWWEVDLGKTYQVTRVVITNRGDCCWDRLSFMEISVGDKQPFTLNPSCVTGGKQGQGEGKSWTCELTGRYVTVSLLATNYLTLCEVQVYAKVNTPPPADELASLNKVVMQSSTIFGGVAQRGNDGDINSQWPGGTCTHTTLMNDPWWQVDLGRTRSVTKVKITNRADCCWDRLSKLKISVGDKIPYTLNPACVVGGSQGRGETKEWKCPLKGRYVVVSLEKTDYLTLCEVQVFALREASLPPPPPPAGPMVEKLLSKKKHCRQSSVAFGGVCSRAVDGSRNSVYGAGSCTHTSFMARPWWEVDLGKSFQVTKVVITNRGDCCWDRLSNLRISVGNKQPYTLNPSCVTGGKQGKGDTHTWKCPLEGRFVTVSLDSTNYLTLCEVEVYGMTSGSPAVPVSPPSPPSGTLQLVSKGKPCRQSSTAFGGDASRGVDGNKNSMWSGNSCTHTAFTAKPWWEVDLGKSYQVAKVVITNRGDCCWDRLKNFKISVGDKQPYSLNPACVDNGAQGRGETKEWKCPLKGRYVTVNLLGTNYLTLCEVQVYAYGSGPAPPPKDYVVSLRQPVRQSSTAFGGLAERAVDGNKNTVYSAGTCSHTNLAINPFWQVDLGKSYQLTRVKITNRGDCCWDRLRDFKVSVGDTQAYEESQKCVTGGKQGRGETKEWPCALKGRYVTISIPRTEYLTLCEVEVFASGSAATAVSGAPAVPAAPVPAPTSVQIVSLKKPTKQSSTGWGGVPSRAVDGNSNTMYGAGSCTHTTFMAQPWWQVDLQKSYEVTKVVITNRGDCCWDRLNGFRVSVGDSGNWRQNKVCVQNGIQGRGETKAWACPLKGRFVAVSLPGTQYLTLCEVQVFARVPAGNVELNPEPVSLPSPDELESDDTSGVKEVTSVPVTGSSPDELESMVDSGIKEAF